MLRCSHCDHFNLADAKVCERCGGALGAEAQLPSAPASTIETQVLAIAGTSGKIAAIKYYREKTGSGLKDAKEAVEQLLARHRVSAASTGCAGMLLVMALSSLALGTLAVRLAC